MRRDFTQTLQTMLAGPETVEHKVSYAGKALAEIVEVSHGPKDMLPLPSLFAPKLAEFEDALEVQEEQARLCIEEGGLRLMQGEQRMEIARL